MKRRSQDVIDVEKMENIKSVPTDGAIHDVYVTPDGKYLWSTSKVYSSVYIHSLPDLEKVGRVQVGQHPEWDTFTPDSKTGYIGTVFMQQD